MNACRKGLTGACSLLLLAVPCIAGDLPVSALSLHRTAPAPLPVVPVNALAMQTRAGLAFGDLEAGLDCGTPRLLSQRAAPSPHAVETGLSSPPPLLSAQQWSGPEGRLVVHYSLNRSTPDAIPATDRNLNGVPDYVEAVGAGFAATLQAAHRAGFIATLPPSGRLELYLANLGGSVTGYTVPLPSPDRGAAFVVVDSRLFGSETLIRAVAAHQTAHALLAAYDPSEPAWWHEASAAVIETLSQPSLARHLEGIEGLLQRPEAGIPLAGSPGLPSGAGARGGTLWASYLVESSGGRPEILARIWQEAAAVEGDNLLDATEHVLRTRGGSLAAAFADFTSWNLFTGSRDDGRHYPFGALLGDPRFGASHGSYPADSRQGHLIAPLGWSLVRFEPDGSTGGIFLSFEGDASGQWQADVLVSTRHDSGRLHRIALPLDAAGRGTLGLPWNNAAEILLLVRNQTTAGVPAGFAYTARPAPAFPFELASLSAEPGGGQVRLIWETESEDGLHGWDVFRSEGRGPFVRITDVTIPAFGGPDGPVTYQFLDTDVRPGILYQYYVVGLTTEGLSQRSFVVTTRVPR